MAHLDPTIQQRIEDKLRRLNRLRPLPSVAVRKLRERLQIEMTYNSNGIEGNSLTLKETWLVINEGLTIKGKPLRDHLEAKDHHQALEYLHELIDSGKQQSLSEKLIRSLHELVVRETDQEWAGSYRTSNVVIGGSDHTPPDAIEVPGLMRDLIDWLSDQRKILPIIELAALFHHKLVYIHPFFDGNGRTARLMMNVLLLQQGYPLVVILKNDRRKYYRVLDQADKKNYHPIIRFIAQAVERSLDIYLQALTPTNKRRENYLELSQLSKQTPYSTKYLNLLARQGKLEAHKQDRNWLSSLEAVKRYQKNRQRKRN